VADCVSALGQVRGDEGRVTAGGLDRVDDLFATFVAAS
jgi:hypothetical protein